MCFYWQSDEPVQYITVHGLAVELGEADQLLCNAHLGHGVTGIGNNLHTGQDTSWATGSHLGLTSLPSEAKRNGRVNKQREKEREKPSFRRFVYTLKRKDF